MAERAVFVDWMFLPSDVDSSRAQRSTINANWPTQLVMPLVPTADRQYLQTLGDCSNRLILGSSQEASAEIHSSSPEIRV
jgi:hypothetical protein